MKIGIIFSTQRSGTTLINDALMSHPELHSFGEIFSPRDQFAKSAFFCEFSLYKLLIENNNIEQRQSLITEFINQLADNDDRLLCFKLMVDQFLDLRMGEFLNDYFNLRVIKIVRENLLEVVVSRVRSSANNIVHVDRYFDPALKLVRLDPHKVINYLNDVKSANDIVRSSLLGANSILINYVDIVNGLDTVISDVYKFLGVDSSFIPDSNLFKIGSANVWDDISNSEEIVSVLKDSEFNYLI